MLEKHGLLWVQATVGLEEAKWFCNPFAGETEVQRTARVGEMIPRALGYGLNLLRQVCILADIEAVIPEIERLEQLVWPTIPGMPKANPTSIAQAINHLVSRIQDELDSQYFFHVTQTDVQFYLAEKPFGEKVANRFDLANEDISEASKCLALQRPTACVFHLMRIMEIGVQQFGKKLKIKISPKDQTWYQIVMHVTNAIQKLPSNSTPQRTKKSKYAETAAHLQTVRLAWRNEVMHPKQTYTRQEAYEVFNACRVFMSDLAETI